MTHYELFFFFTAGYRPKDIIRSLGYTSSTAYRAYRNYRKAQIRARNLIEGNNPTPFKREKKVNDLDH